MCIRDRYQRRVHGENIRFINMKFVFLLLILQIIVEIVSSKLYYNQGENVHHKTNVASHGKFKMHKQKSRLRKFTHKLEGQNKSDTLNNKEKEKEEVEEVEDEEELSFGAQITQPFEGLYKYITGSGR
eukprot:TRINITY_DN20011_c0_g1_i1.p1 TRINITY_DN20011_c0_g1~~TRINITY_DN20011_c0_g1_i1.p1  ORF type:complete len:128 (-),score=28.56 TRINITY_DN20011_c0_g1_i1:11-394(-)